MFGNFEGDAGEKLRQVASIMATLVPQATCRLSDDRSIILCEGRRCDGELWIERLPTGLLPAEIVRHAAMRLGKATHNPGAISDWERWATAWHLIQTRGDKAIDFADERLAAMFEEDNPAGIAVWTAIRPMIALLQADPTAFPGQA